MKKFLLLSIGFEMPTPEIMEAWGKWFGSIADKTVDSGGFSSGIEITRDGSKELPWDLDSITGYLVINAEDMDEAEKIAKTCTIITSTRVYEIRSK